MPARNPNKYASRFHEGAKQFIFLQHKKRVWRISFSLPARIGKHWDGARRSIKKLIRHMAFRETGRSTRGHTFFRNYKLNPKQWFTLPNLWLLWLLWAILDFWLCKLLYSRKMETLWLTWLEILPKDCFTAFASSDFFSLQYHSHFLKTATKKEGKKEQVYLSSAYLLAESRVRSGRFIWHLADPLL